MTRVGELRSYWLAGGSADRTRPPRFEGTLVLMRFTENADAKRKAEEEAAIEVPPLLP